MLAKGIKDPRVRRQQRLRFTIRGTSERPRLSVFRSTKHIYAQVIDDSTGRTLAAASSLDKELRTGEGSKSDLAEKVGALIVERALKAGVTRLVFDRNGFLYTGRVAAVSKAAHEAGLLTKDGWTGEADNSATAIEQE